MPERRDTRGFHGVDVKEVLDVWCVKVMAW